MFCFNILPSLYHIIINNVSPPTIILHSNSYIMYLLLRNYKYIQNMILYFIFYYSFSRTFLVLVSERVMRLEDSYL